MKPITRKFEAEAVIKIYKETCNSLKQAQDANDNDKIDLYLNIKGQYEQRYQAAEKFLHNYRERQARK